MPCLKPEIALFGLFLSSAIPLSTLFCNPIDDKRALQEEGRVNKLWKVTRILQNNVAPEVHFQGDKVVPD